MFLAASGSSGSPAILAAPRSGGISSSPFSQQVRRSFGRRAGDYDRLARLQRAVDWRLARLGRSLPLLEGPCADLGAGSGLFSRALLAHHPSLRRQPLLQLDLCPELLACNPLTAGGPESPAASSLVWDLNGGLPPQLQGAALLASSFALQWLEQPARQLGHWIRQLRAGGWLVLAVPTAGSFPQWRQAAIQAGVPCTALELPPAAALLQAAQREGLQLQHSACLRYSRPAMGGLPALRHLQQLGAGTSRRAPLAPAQLRRLLQHWPPHSPLTWEVLLLIGRRVR
ncbi:MAG: SAM-dependent methyltransferase [Cyanobium sp.]